MKAAIAETYGPAELIRIGDVPRPAVGDDTVLVEVHAAAVTTADWRIRASAFPAFAWIPGRLMFGLLRPKDPVRGTDFSGRVAEVGSKVTRFSPGDAVFGFSGRGAHAAFVAVSEGGPISRKPESLSDAEAAAVPFGALAALGFLRDFAKIKAGERVLVGGASGGVGVFLVQLAKHFGAHVTGIASTANLGLVRNLGADRVIDYTQTDFAMEDAEYDVVLDTVGAISVSKARRVLAADGRFVPIEFSFAEIAGALIAPLLGRQRVIIGVSGDRQADLDFIGGLLESGAIRPVVDAVFPLEEIIAAHRRVEGRHKRGSVVVAIAAGTAPSA
ncbi:MAG: NAD(P)-dependent alcohol dehydrogenase [Rhodobiaceae bacterium]|nr:NAD(P)-dependent alcohol dehydrogenase [Rhodobiaceae bacterium]